jgi:PKD repeat protein
VLQALNSNKISGNVPLSVVFSWIAASDPDGDPVSCVLDTNSDGTLEFPAFDCTTITSQNFIYQTAGTFVAKLTATDGKGGSVSRTVSITANAVVAPGSYDIILRYSAAFPAKFKPAFEEAATRWHNVITADVPDSTETFDPADCGLTGQTNVVGVDDLVIWVDTIPFDAANPNLLGRAGPCRSRNITRLTIIGDMAFVDTKMDGLLASNQLTNTVLHEMGHVLGIGTHWNNNPSLAIGLSTDPNTCGANPQFVGTNALREYHALGGTGNITIENTSGPGTCDGHWKETIFGTELMTGFLNAGVANPLSSITLGSMQDLGYSIDLSKADPYSIPAPGTALVRSTTPLIVTRPVDHIVP